MLPVPYSSSFSEALRDEEAAFLELVLRDPPTLDPVDLVPAFFAVFLVVLEVLAMVV